MTLSERLAKDLVEAMKTKQETRLGALRMLKTALKKYEVDTLKPLNATSEAQVVGTLVKQREEAADLFRKGGRVELAEKEEAEITVLRAYLPEPASADELDAAVSAALLETHATSAKEMGAVMKVAQGRLAGKFVDGKALSERVKARLGI